MKSMRCWATSRHRYLPRRLHLQQCRTIALDNRYVKVSEEVQQAIAEKRPVVALESTIYTHGFPYPQNMVLATNLESIARSTGAIPATVGILDGIARIGLDGDDLIRLASSSQEPESLLKVSRRDLSFALTAKLSDGRPYSGGTTVAGTMVLAHMAGIMVFATGGLGGVHRGAAESFDVSADLTELGRTPVAVISAGCKAFLDIPKTLEYLETQGVAVATLADGRDGKVDLPGFWSRDSGFKSPLTIPDERSAAEMIVAQHALGLQSGILFGNPVPEDYEIPMHDIQDSIEAALLEATQQGATGNLATPFILAKIKELTGSRSVATNTALVENNVRVGARIAMEVSFLEKYHESRVSRPSISVAKPMSLGEVNPGRQSLQARTPKPNTGAVSASQNLPDVFVAGMLAVDLSCDYKPRKESESRSLELQTSNPARITQSLGGVGHNVARAVQLAGANVRLLSAVGADMNGASALAALNAEDIGTQSIVTFPEASGRRTAQYVAVNDHKKDLVVAMADMAILESDGVDPTSLDEAFSSTWIPDLTRASPNYIVVDANWSPQYLGKWLTIAKDCSGKVVYEPVSTAKSIGLFHHSDKSALGIFPRPSVHIATPNEAELTSMYHAARAQGYFDSEDWWHVIDALGIPSSGARARMTLATSAEFVDSGIPQMSVQLLPYMPCITTKLGARGVLVTQIIPTDDPRLQQAEYAAHMLALCNNGSEEQIGVGGVYMRLFPASEVVPDDEVVSVNGVGDTFAGVLVAGLAKAARNNKPQWPEAYIDIAQRASVFTLKSAAAVSDEVASLADSV